MVRLEKEKDLPFNLTKGLYLLPGRSFLPLSMVAMHAPACFYNFYLIVKFQNNTCSHYPIITKTSIDKHGNKNGIMIRVFLGLGSAMTVHSQEEGSLSLKNE